VEPFFIALYVGPDQVMPVMSILATIAGFFLIFWNKVMGLIRRIAGIKRSAEPEATSAPGASPAAASEPPKQA
jgi:hypothetical protein